MFQIQKRLTVLIFAAAIVPVFSLAAQEGKTELLWPNGAPDAAGTEDKDKPTLITYLPEAEQATGTGIIICPGGGYGGLAIGHEAHDIAKWLNRHGIAAFICDYRHRGNGYGHPAPMQDAQRAIRIVRARADEFQLDSSKIGVIGFSAGGHLASTVSTHFDAGRADDPDPIKRVSCRPDFAILCYPVIAFDEPYTHRGSQKNLLGENADPELLKMLSNEKQVTQDNPPTFLWHTGEDAGVPAENSVQFYLALKSKNVPAELHIYQKGRHGVGLAADIDGTSDWPAACVRWLTVNDFLKK